MNCNKTIRYCDRHHFNWSASELRGSATTNKEKHNKRESYALNNKRSGCVLALKQNIMWLHRIKLFSSLVHVCCVCVYRVLSLPLTEWSLGRYEYIHLCEANESECNIIDGVLKHDCHVPPSFFRCSMGERLVALCLLTFYSPYSQCVCTLKIGRFIIMTILLSSTSTNIMLLWLSLFSLSFGLYVWKSVSCCRYLDGPRHQFVIINIYNFGLCCRWILKAILNLDVCGSICGTLNAIFPLLFLIDWEDLLSLPLLRH